MSGMSRVTPAAIVNVCSAIVVVSPVARSRPKASSRSRAIAEAASDQRDEEQEDRGRAEHAELLAERRQDEVARRERDQVGRSATETGADEAARREREPALRELSVADVVHRGRLERVQPVGDAVLDVRQRPGTRSPRPPRTGRRPSAGTPTRPLATQSITTKTPKKSIEAPRSRSRNRTASEAPQARSSGPRSFARGRPSRPTPASSSSRFAERYEARKMTMRIFPNSAGWNVSGPRCAHRRAPFTSNPTPGDHRQEQEDQAEEPDRVGVAVQLRGRRERARASATKAASPIRSQIA